MVIKIRLLLDYKCYPVWLYDENENIINTLLPEELRSDIELDKKFDNLQMRYDALFKDGQRGFSFIGFRDEDEKIAFFHDWEIAKKELIEKTKGKYIIIDEIGKSL